MELGYYKSVLHPPPVKTVYRGIKFKTIEDVSKFLDLPIDEINDADSIKLNKSIDHKNGYSSSWTSQKSIAQDSLFISWNGAGKKGYFVTLYANVKDNPYKFIAGPGGLYDVDGLSKWHLEKETIGLEPIIVSKIEWKKL